MPRRAPPPTRPRPRLTRRWNAALPDRDEQFRLKREALIAMAVRLFNERGYHETSLADIAGHLQVTKPALYHYVSGKEELLLECQRRGTALLVATIGEVELHPGNGLDRLREFIAQYAATVTTDFATCVVRSGPDALGEAFRKEILVARRRIERTLEGILQQGVADGSIAPCDTRMCAFSIFGALHWLCFWFREGGPLTRAQIGEHMADLFIQGLARRVRTPAASRRS